MATYAVKLERSVPLILPRHPDAPEDENFVEWCVAEKKSGRPLAIDLFSGAGGLGAGVEAAGWTVVAAVDHDKAALETHRANFRGRALEVDMSDSTQVASLIEELRPLGIDLIAGGPPCQPFSRAGRAARPHRGRRADRSLGRRRVEAEERVRGTGCTRHEAGTLMRSSRQGAIPSDIGKLIDDLNDIERRLGKLETLSGEALSSTVRRLNDTVATLETLVETTEATPTEFIENDVEAIVDARTAVALAEYFVGDVTVDGALTVAGVVTVPGARATDLGAASSRVTAWIAGDGRLGHT